MIRIVMHGCNGRMGRVISDIVREADDLEITAGVDVAGGEPADYPVFSDIDEVDPGTVDVVIDFSRSDITDHLLDVCVQKKLPLVLCTTGLSEDTLKHLEKAGSSIAVLRSANMSVGVNVMMKLLSEAAPILKASGFDIEIVEKHHNQKLDAPSGTALALAECINASLPEKEEFVYDRSGRREKRPAGEIGISAVRGGTIVGDHDVIFAGFDEVITISHRAYSRSIFAKGALEAAKYLADKPAGIYDMSDVVGSGSRT